MRAPYTREEAIRYGRKGGLVAAATRKRKKRLAQTLDLLMSGRETRDDVLAQLEGVIQESAEGRAAAAICRDTAFVAELYRRATMDCGADAKLLSASNGAAQIIVDLLTGMDDALDDFDRELHAAEYEAAQSGGGTGAAGGGIIEIPAVDQQLLADPPEDDKEDDKDDKDG